MTAQKTSSSERRVLHHGQPSTRPRFIQPVVLKQASLFLLCTDVGDMDPRSEQGLYFHDMRYLSRSELRINGASLVSLLADASEGHHGVFELTNHDLKNERGEAAVGKESLGVRREKLLGDDYTETLTVQNFIRTPVNLTVTLRYEADFADMFVVRGAAQEKRGRLRGPAWQNSDLLFEYEGADGHKRSARLKFSQDPDSADEHELSYRLTLAPQERWRLKVTCELRDEGAELETRPSGEQGSRDEDRRRARGGSLAGGSQIETSNPLFNALLTRSFIDLNMLRMQQKDDVFFAAGVPWYVALFGRDSLVTAIQTLAIEPEIGANTLRVLASHQGTKVDDWRDEQPGKILHELRVDEMANLDEIPQTPYYGSIDSTLLFLALLGLNSQWTGSLDLFHELRPNVDAALKWLDDYGDSDGDGFIDYKTRSEKGLRNQGWKDSGNGTVMEDGRLAEPPIALPEVQGDAYIALQSVADLFDRDGDGARANALRSKAKELYRRFNESFYLKDEKYYAFCRQADGRFSRSIASNPAQALWTGIIDPEHAAEVADRVLQPDMFSGWGVRTLSSEDASYNPVDYQVGSIWPHDNSFIFAGMRRHGLNEQAHQVFRALMEAASEFEHFRLPETFAGYPRSEASRPVKYPVACNPQAWAAGSLPFMLISCLGLQPRAFERRLRIEQPSLPEWLQEVHVRGLRIADASVDLEYRREGRVTTARVTDKRGDVEVLLE